MNGFELIEQAVQAGLSVNGAAAVATWSDARIARASELIAIGAPEATGSLRDLGIALDREETRYLMDDLHNALAEQVGPAAVVHFESTGTIRITVPVEAGHALLAAIRV